MNHERKVSIAETGVGLALVICLLLVIGYTALHYLGGARRTPAVEIQPGIASEPDTAVPERDEQPHVLTIESNDTPTGTRHTVLPGAGSALRTLPDTERR